MDEFGLKNACDGCKELNNFFMRDESFGGSV